MAEVDTIDIPDVAAATRTVATMSKALKTAGLPTDDKNAATDTTSVTHTSLLKQISASVQAPPSQAVTNAGTFAVQSASTLAAETTKVIGTVRVASGGIASGSVASGAIASGAVASGAVAAGALATGAGVDGWDLTQGAIADAASATGSISAKLRGIATALGITAFDLGSGTGGTRTLRTMIDTTQVASVLDCSTTVTRPADTNAYTANDAFSNSTSAPTAGGFTFTSAAAASGGGGMITDAVIVASAGTLYQGEIWVCDSAVTAINDNAAFAVSDGDMLLVLGKIPFTLAVEAVNNSSAHVSGLNIGYHCVGTANLRFLVKILNAPTPGNAETLTVRIKGIRS